MASIYAFHALQTFAGVSVDNDDGVLLLEPLQRLHNLCVFGFPSLANTVIPSAGQHLHNCVRQNQRSGGGAEGASRAVTAMTPLHWPRCKCSCRAVDGSPIPHRTCPPRSCEEISNSSTRVERKDAAADDHQEYSPLFDFPLAAYSITPLPCFLSKALRTM